MRTKIEKHTAAADVFVLLPARFFACQCCAAVQIRNVKRKNLDGRLFEFAKVYHPKSLPLSELPIENNVVTLGMFGEEEDFFSMKGVIEDLLNNFVGKATISYVPSKKACMHPTRSADVIVNGQTIGYFGELLPLVADKLDIDKRVYVAEINYDVLKEHFDNKIVFKPISKFPTVERDVAIIVDNSVLWADVVDTVKKNAGDNLDSIKLFDVYTGDQIENGKKSLAFNLIFISEDRTLNVEEIDIAIQNILTALNNNLGAKLR